MPKKPLTHKYSPKPFNPEDYKVKVQKELDSGQEINALFLVHGYLESYLTEWLFIQGKQIRKELSNKTIKEVAKIGFKNLLNIHLVLGNIDHALYAKLEKVNDFRNDIAHYLTTIDINNKKEKEKIAGAVRTAIDICDEISKKYVERLGERAKELTPPQAP